MPKHIPNTLTCMRILMVPLFVLLHFLNMHAAALTVFVLAEITDILDGFIARRFHCISNVGMMLDPLADKITFIGILLCLFISRRVPAWLLALLITRELMMILGGTLLWRSGMTCSADRFGKFTSALFFTAAVLLFPWHDIPLLITIGSTLLILSLISSVIASVHYVRRYLHMAAARRAAAK